MIVRLEPRLSTPRWLSPIATVLAVVVALVISAAILALVGGDPIRAYSHILTAAFGSVGVISDTLVKATPLILTGLACSIAFRMRLWNIGAEGQFLLGAWGASAVLLVPLVPEGTPAFIVIPAMMLAGALAGAAWAFIPAILRARLGVNEIITTLMLNYVALQWIQFWVFGPWSEGGFQQTEQFPREAWLPRLTDFASLVPDFGGLTIHLGFVFGVVAAGLVWLLLERSRLGFEIRIAGDSPRAARYAGVRISRTIIVVFLISGALAGLVGMQQILVNNASTSTGGYLPQNYEATLGFTGIAVAFLGQNNPIGIVFAAIFWASLSRGESILPIETDMPREFVIILQGVLIMSVVITYTLAKRRLERRQTGRVLAEEEIVAVQGGPVEVGEALS